MPHSVTHKPSHSMNRKVFIQVALCVSPTIAWQCRTAVKLSLEGAWVPHGPSRCESGPEARRAVLPLWQHKSKCRRKDSRVTTTIMRVGKRWMEDNRQHHHGELLPADCCFCFCLLWGCLAMRHRSRGRKYWDTEAEEDNIPGIEIYLMTEYSLPPFGISLGCLPNIFFILFLRVIEHLYHLLFSIDVNVFLLVLLILPPHTL